MCLHLTLPLLYFFPYDIFCVHYLVLAPHPRPRKLSALQSCHWTWAPRPQDLLTSALHRAYSIPATGVLLYQLPEDSRCFKHSKTQPSKGCVSSALIPGHWGISRVLCHLKLTLSERERVGSKTHTVIHTFSLYPWVIEKPSGWAHRHRHPQLVVLCASCDFDCMFNVLALSYNMIMFVLLIFLSYIFVFVSIMGMLAALRAC